MKSSHIQRATHLCQTFTSVRTNVCAIKDRQQEAHEPASCHNGLCPTFSLFSLSPLSIILSFPPHLSLLASRSRCYPPRRSSSRWRGAALDLSPPSWPPPLHTDIFGYLLSATNLLTCFMCTSELLHNQLSQELPRGDFSSQHAWLASASDEEVSLGRSRV